MKKILMLILCCMFFCIMGCSNNKLEFEKDTMLEDNQKTNVESEQGVDREDDYDATEESPVPKKTIVTDVMYQEVLPYLDNRIVVKQAGRYGIIDNVGNIIMPITQPYVIAPLNMNAVKFLDNNNKKLGVLSLGGEVLVPAIYNDVSNINEDLIWLEKRNSYEENGKLYVDAEDIYKTINKFYSVKNKDYLDLEIIGRVNIVAVGQSFFVINYSSEYERGIKKIITFDGKIIDVNENVSFEYELLDVIGSGTGWSSEATIYKTSNDSEYLISQRHLLDMNGNIIIDFSNEDSKFVFDSSKDFCCSNEVIISEIIRKEEYKNYYNHYVFNLITHEKKKIETIDDNILIKDKMSNGFYEINVLHEDVWKDYYGIMNDKYEIVLEPIYDSVDDYVNGYCPIELNEYIGFVDEAGNVLVPQFPEENIVDDDGFTYLYTPPYGRGSLINPRTGEILQYEEADLKNDFDGAETLGIFEAILTDEDTGDEYKSFVTWDGPIVDHKFPNTKITLSQDGKVAVYNKGTLYTIVELQ